MSTLINILIITSGICWSIVYVESIRIGTLTPTIFGTMEGNWFITVTGIICFVYDVIYIYALRKVKESAVSTTTMKLAK